MTVTALPPRPLVALYTHNAVARGHGTRGLFANALRHRLAAIRAHAAGLG